MGWELRWCSQLSIFLFISAKSIIILYLSVFVFDCSFGSIHKANGRYKFKCSRISFAFNLQRFGYTNSIMCGPGFENFKILRQINSIIMPTQT